MRILGSEDATTCHIVVLRCQITSWCARVSWVVDVYIIHTSRDSNTGVTGLAHLDNDEPEDFLMLEREVSPDSTSWSCHFHATFDKLINEENHSCIHHCQVRDRKGVKTTTRELEDMEYDVSLLGGYCDEEDISQDITEMLLVVMQVVKIVTVIKMDTMRCDTHYNWMYIAHQMVNRCTVIYITCPESNKLFMLQVHWSVCLCGSKQSYMPLWYSSLNNANWQLLSRV